MSRNVDGVQIYWRLGRDPVSPESRCPGASRDSNASGDVSLGTFQPTARGASWPVWSVPPRSLGIVERSAPTESICPLFRAGPASLHNEVPEERPLQPES